MRYTTRIMFDKRYLKIIGIVVLAFIAGTSFGVFLQKSLLSKVSVSEVNVQHEKSTMVMPFDAEQAKHIFHELPSGGMFHVYTSATNTEQVALIQMRLRVEYDRYRTGNFSDQIRLYGADIPGTNGLSENYSKIQFIYTDLPTGAQIQFISSDPEVVRAIHAWIREQLVEHGADAESYM